MEVFAKNLKDWSATLSVAEAEPGRFRWHIQVADQRWQPVQQHLISSGDAFSSMEETIADGHAALDQLEPQPRLV